MKTPPLITLERAWDLVGLERLAQLRECHDMGWADWQAIQATKSGADLSPTARAQIVHDGAVAHAKRTFPESRWRDLQGLFALDLDELLCRFKKVDRDLAPRGIPTGQSVLFEEQRQMSRGQQLSLWEPVPMVIVGYVLDAFGLSIERHVFVLRRDGDVIWSRDLPVAETGTAPVRMPKDPSTGPAPADVRSARAESGASEKAN